MFSKAFLHTASDHFVSYFFWLVHQVIQVTFDKFVLEADVYCRFDYVAFFNGGERDDSRLIGKYCGDQAPEWVAGVSKDVCWSFKKGQCVVLSYH